MSENEDHTEARMSGLGGAEEGSSCTATKLKPHLSATSTWHARHVAVDPATDFSSLRLSICVRVAFHSRPLPPMSTVVL